MQVWNIFETAPVASVQGLRIAQADGGSNQLLIAPRAEYHDAIGQRAGKLQEKVHTEIRLTGAQVIGAGIAFVNPRPEFGIDVVAVQCPELQRLLFHQLPFAPDFLASLAAQCCQESRKVAVAAIKPLELEIGAQQEIFCRP